MKTESEACIFFFTVVISHAILLPLSYIWAKRRYDRIMKSISDKDREK